MQAQSNLQGGRGLHMIVHNTTSALAIFSMNVSFLRSLLCSSLFSADVLLQKAILQVKYLCEAASSSVSSSDLKAGSSRYVG